MGLARRRRTINDFPILKGYSGNELIKSAVVDPTTVGRGGMDEVQTVTITGSPTGGTFTLTFNGKTTTGIAYNATKDAVEDALQALTSVGAGNVHVTGSGGGPYTVRFVNDLGRKDVPTMTASGASLTGGTTPAVGVVVTTGGVVEDSNLYVLLKGTILTVNPDNTAMVKEYVAASGEAIIGIADRTVEFVTNDLSSAKDIDYISNLAVFILNNIRNYTTYTSQLATWATDNNSKFE